MKLARQRQHLHQLPTASLMMAPASCLHRQLGRPLGVDIRPLHLLLTACQLISHNFELMKFGCCNVQTSKFHMNLYMTSVARQQVLPDVTYFVAF